VYFHVAKEKEIMIQQLETLFNKLSHDNEINKKICLIFSNDKSFDEEIYFDLTIELRAFINGIKIGMK